MLCCADAVCYAVLWFVDAVCYAVLCCAHAICYAVLMAVRMMVVPMRGMGVPSSKTNNPNLTVGEIRR